MVTKSDEIFHVWLDVLIDNLVFIHAIMRRNEGIQCQGINFNVINDGILSRNDT